MSIKACPTDANGRRLLDSGTDWAVDYVPLTDAWRTVQLPYDVKAFAFSAVSTTAGNILLRGTLPGSKEFLKAVAVIDNGATVTLHTGLPHGFTVGDDCEIHGTTYYDGTWPLETGSTGDHLIITADPHVLDLEGIVVVDATGGKVSIAYTGHGFNDGDTVTIAGSDNYDESYTLHADSTANVIVLTEEYIAETFAEGVIASGFPTETLAVTEWAVGYRDLPIPPASGTDEIRVVKDQDTTLGKLKCGTGAATGYAAILYRR